MSYTHTFGFSYNLLGNASTISYKIPLTPEATSTSMYGVHFHSALQVELEEVEATIAVLNAPKDHVDSVAAIAFIDSTLAPKTSHDIALGGTYASAGSTTTIKFTDSIGLRRILKGVLDAGAAPALIIGLTTQFDSSSKEVAFLTVKIKAKFAGQSSASVFNQSVGAPKAQA